MQKSIRRGLEREAMEFACELIDTSKGFHSMVCKRLEVISHEDVDCISQPHIIPFVHTCVTQAMKYYDAERIGFSRLFIGNAIRLMARAKKSREADHFCLAVGLASEQGHVPDVPDYAYDQHTLKGKQMGRGLDYFRKEAAKLVPAAKPDKYEDEAYSRLADKMRSNPRTRKAAGKVPTLFDVEEDE
jgi:replication-associated recombination protein RarA